MRSTSRAYNLNNLSALSNDLLRKASPSVFAEFAHGSTSERYTQIPTIQVVEALRAEGWMPVLATETRVRDESKFGFAKHLLRFRHRDDLERGTFQVNDKFSEVVVVNSHDGSSSYQLHAGIYRLACSNGMIVADSTLETQRVRHSGDVVNNVIEGVYSIVEELPAIEGKIDNFRSIQLHADEQRALATAAMSLRWDEAAPVDQGSVLQVKRASDRGDDLWMVFNRVQENIIRGGLRGFTQDQNGRPKRTTTREVKSVNENVRLNKALWMLADEMAKLKA